ncbi:class I SAM-dependent methyltransferase [Paenibacillus glycanilyticus]|uniref:class I SAM-dependent methyltransferase n=1 Tax=Paenibacillus glycanilyticus TaxID=126569 RepID=UPI00203F78A4|nr:class I SAM-dependent methyltransferase [Paenibacillus glycanilyticus]MCM3628671.1 class I SAM-dependent methyltransferase [Paenibacillus glycanilyticus]
MSSVNKIKESWNEWSDTWYPKYRTEEAIARIIAAPASAFHPGTFAMIREAFPDLLGTRVLVPSSGDNHAVFAFHLMGAKVTSCDISEKQLEYASNIADKHGWDIEFVCEDTMTLAQLPSEEYDFVYTSNGVHVWIHDLAAMYTQVNRVLKKNGIYMMYDIHPFMRPFGIKAKEALIVQKPYDLTGPFGEVPTFKWRMQDIVNAIISSLLSVERLEEMYAEDGWFWVDDSTNEEELLTAEEVESYTDWHQNPSAAIPQWLSIKAIK